MDLIGTTLGGKYQLKKFLGEGGLGQVYLAEQQPMGRRVALKLLHPEVAQNERIAARFEREARTAARLTHPNIVVLHDFGAEELPEGPRLYLVMEYLKGETLWSRLCAKGRLSPQEAVEVMAQVLLALEVCHEAGILHRDIKPDNVMLCPGAGREQAKLLDFGIAKLIGEEGPSVTRTGQLIGTPLYMAPEQIGSDKSIGPQADLYAVGVMLHEILTGKPPFEGDNHLEIFKKHFHEPPPLLPGELAAFRPVLARALEKSPADRFTSAREFREALSQALSAHTAATLEPLEEDEMSAPTRVDLRAPWPLELSLELTVAVSPGSAAAPRSEAAKASQDERSAATLRLSQAELRPSASLEVSETVPMPRLELLLQEETGEKPPLSLAEEPTPLRALTTQVRTAPQRKPRGLPSRGRALVRLWLWLLGILGLLRGVKAGASLKP